MPKRLIKVTLSIFMILLSSFLIVFISYNSIKENTTTLELNKLEVTFVALCTIVIVCFLVYLIISKLGKKEIIKEHIFIYLLAIILGSIILSVINISIINSIYIIDKPNNVLEISAKNHHINENETYENITLEETRASKSVLIADNSSILLNGITINKSGDSTSKAYSLSDGLNAALIALNSKVDVLYSTITTDGIASYGLFAKDEKSIINIKNSKIETLKDSSYGLILRNFATGIINDSEIITHSIDAHGVFVSKGKLEINNTKITTLLEDSSGVYIKDEAIINNSIIESLKSAAISVEDSGKLTIEKGSIITKGINIFRLSENQVSETANITLSGTTIKNNSETLFSITNTKAIMNLSGVNLNESEYLLKITKNDADESLIGSSVELNANSQILVGEIFVDSLSNLTLNLKNNSSLTTVVNKDNLAKNVTLNISADSKLNLKGDAYIHVFINEDLDFNNINDHGYNIYYDKKNVENNHLDGKTFKLKNGGELKPI